jgi:hypothetical protein
MQAPREPHVRQFTLSTRLAALWAYVCFLATLAYVWVYVCFKPAHMCMLAVLRLCRWAHTTTAQWRACLFSRASAPPTEQPQQIVDTRLPVQRQALKPSRRWLRRRQAVRIKAVRNVIWQMLRVALLAQVFAQVLALAESALQAKVALQAESAQQAESALQAQSALQPPPPAPPPPPLPPPPAPPPYDAAEQATPSPAAGTTTTAAAAITSAQAPSAADTQPTPTKSAMKSARRRANQR